MSIPSILVVEDDYEMQEMMLKFLRKNGFIVYAATNSDELQNELKKHRIDLILLDVMLGDENGITICKEIRINQNIPIIIVSALATDQDRLSGYGVGADTAGRILKHGVIDDENLCKAIMTAEKQYALTRGFWDD